jgi:hypothetical protein
MQYKIKLSSLYNKSTLKPDPVHLEYINKLNNVTRLKKKSLQKKTLQKNKKYIKKEKFNTAKNVSNLIKKNFIVKDKFKTAKNVSNLIKKNWL